MNELTINEKTIGEWIEKSEESLSKYATREYNKDSFFKSAMLAINESKELKECMSTKSGQLSIFNSLRYAASTGLSLNPQEGAACLIAYKGQCKYQIMKNGMIDLVMESGKVDFISSDAVHENDDWEIIKTMNGDNFTFVPDRTERGKIQGFFAALRMMNGIGHVKYMTAKQIDDHRKTYSKYNKLNEEQYGNKTILKALLIGLNISKELNISINNEEMLDKKQDKGYSSEDIKKELTDSKTIINVEAKVKPDTRNDNEPLF